MTDHMRIQIDTMIVSINTFLKSLEIAALKDDQVISKSEMKIIKKARNASEGYKKELLKLKEI